MAGAILINILSMRGAITHVHCTIPYYAVPLSSLPPARPGLHRSHSISNGAGPPSPHPPPLHYRHSHSSPPTPPPLPYATATHRITTTARVTGTDLCVLSTRLRGGEIRRGFDRWREIMHR
jgi:hypothetical protein